MGVAGVVSASAVSGVAEFVAATVEGGEQEGLSRECIGWRDGVTGPEPLLPNYL